MNVIVIGWTHVRHFSGLQVPSDGHFSSANRMSHAYRFLYCNHFDSRVALCDDLKNVSYGRRQLDNC
jgi:hypothetical protein